MMKIGKPGQYEIPAEVYHGDCCIAPSLSASGAVEILDECPRMFWHNSYLNPEREIEDKRCFTLGTCAHMLFLEPHLMEEKVAIIDAENYRTKAAQELKKAAQDAGKLPILSHEFSDVLAMRRELFSHPVAGKAFQSGRAEQTLIWQDEITGVWCKSRPDWIPTSGTYLIDYKTSTTANPEAFQRKAAELGYYQKAAWQMEGMKAVTGERPRRFYFVLQSVKAPYLVSVFELDSGSIMWGDILNAKSREVFAKCLKEDRWPSYCPLGSDTEKAFDLNITDWQERQLQKKHEMGAFAVGVHIQQPLQGAAK